MECNGFGQLAPCIRITKLSLNMSSDSVDDPRDLSNPLQTNYSICLIKSVILVLLDKLLVARKDSSTPIF
jgi:hypothetical protein